MKSSLRSPPEGAVSSNTRNRSGNVFAPQLLALSVLIGGTLVAGPMVRGAGSSARPNIVIILADDLGYGDVGAFGQKLIQTPHLDQLANEGLRFTSAYAGTSVCAPSRCVLYTGLYTNRAQVRGNAVSGQPQSDQALKAGDVTFASLLQQAGYQTALIGKWGLGEPGAAASGLPHLHGFDYFYGYLSQYHAHNSWPSFLWRNQERVPLDNVVPDEAPNGAGVTTVKKQFANELIFAEAESFLERVGNQPFLLLLAPTPPHANNERRKPHGIEVPSLGVYAYRPWPEAQKAYAALVTDLDMRIGRFLATLTRLGLDNNTLVLFTSDNGPHKEVGGDPVFFSSSGPYRGHKRDLYEGGIRMPTIARWPGVVAAGTTNDTPWSFADVLPTLTDLAGLKTPAGLDGKTFAPSLRGRSQPELSQRPMIWELYESGYKAAVRLGPWKIVRNRLDQPWELYDLTADPGETSDLAALHPDRVTELEACLESSRTESSGWPRTLEAYGKSLFKH